MFMLFSLGVIASDQEDSENLVMVTDQDSAGEEVSVLVQDGEESSNDEEAPPVPPRTSRLARQQEEAAQNSAVSTEEGSDNEEAPPVPPRRKRAQQQQVAPVGEEDEESLSSQLKNLVQQRIENANEDDAVRLNDLLMRLNKEENLLKQLQLLVDFKNVYEDHDFFGNIEHILRDENNGLSRLDSLKLLVNVLQKHVDQFDSKLQKLSDDKAEWGKQLDLWTASGSEDKEVRNNIYREMSKILPQQVAINAEKKEFVEEIENIQKEIKPLQDEYDRKNSWNPITMVKNYWWGSRNNSSAGNGGGGASADQ